MQKLLKVLGLSLLLLSLAVAVVAQTETGQITGTVRDKSGAVVPGAKITLVAVETNTTRTAVSTAAGLYNFPSLKPATYKVTVEAAGFQKYERQVTVNVASNVEVSPNLTVGSSSVVVEVSATSADIAVNTENQTISTVISSKELDALPTDSNRNPYALVGLSSNVNSDTNSNRGAGYSMNGERSSSTNVLLDGAENVDTFTASVGQVVPLDSVQEFSVLTSNFGAEFGRASGGVVNLVTKSGTNQFHGSVYEFNRVSALGSNTYYNVATDTPKSVYTRNNFGFSVGGPIIKNKLFFFENLEWLRVRSAGNTPGDIIDPGSYSLLGTTSQAFMAQYGKLRSGLKQTGQGPCNSPGLAGSTLTCDTISYAAATDAGGGPPENTWDNVSKIDWNISGKTTLTARYAAYKEIDEDGYNTNSPYAGYDTGITTHNQNYTAALTHIFSPNVVSTTKLVYNRLYQLQGLGGAGVGPTLYLASSVPSIATAGGQPLEFPGYLPESPGLAIPFGGPQNLYQTYQDFSVTKGRHQLKFGAQFIQLRDNRTFGAYENAVETLGTGYKVAGVTTSAQTAGLANLLSGNLYQFSSAVNPQGKFPCYKDVNGNTLQTADCTVTLPINKPSFARNYQYNDGALYAQDSWKVTSRLTVNAGLRWEYYGVQHNSDPSLDSNFVMGTGANIFDQIRNGAVKLRRDGGVFWKPDYANFAPRLGFAWDPFGNGKTSLRGGYSIGYERNFGNVTYNAIQNPPNYAVVALSADTPAQPGDLHSMPVYTDNNGPLGGTGSKALPQVSQRAINQNMKTAYAETWNLGIERTVFTNAILSVSYAGSHGIHQYDIANLNNSGTGALYLGDPYSGSRDNLQYTAMNYRSDGGYNYYDALLVGFKANDIHRTGLTLVANYQWSHTLDNISSTFTDGVASNYGTGYLDAFNPKLNYGNADYNIPQRFVASASWELPWMKNAANKAERYALGGWAVAGTIKANSGNPFTIWDCDNYNGTTCPFYAPNAKVSQGSVGAKVANEPGIFNYITLPLDASGNAYNAGNSLGLPACTGLFHVGCTYTADGSKVPDRNQFKAPGVYNLDMQFLKNFKFTEKFGMQFRAEFYNILNHHNQYILGTNLDVSGTNNIQTLKGGTGGPLDDHRNVDLGLKITF